MDNSTAAILVIDDDPSEFFLISKLLEPLAALILEAKDSQEALSALGKYDVSIILMRVLIDSKSSISILRSIRSRKLTKNIPAIFITQKGIDQELLLEGYKAGAVDYIFKPIDKEVLLSKCQVFIELNNTRNKLQKTILELGNYSGKLEQMNHQLQREVADHQKTLHSKERLEKILLHNQKIQAIGTLAGGIAHDFNNILFAVSGYIELAMKEGNRDKLQSYFEKVVMAVDRGKSLVNSILSFSRQQPLKFNAVSLQNIIEQAIDLLRPTLPLDVLLEVLYFTEMETIWGDEAQLEQVFINIINNAIDAIPEGKSGKVSVKVDTPVVDEKTYTELPSLKREMDYYRITICDSGTGMDEETVRRAFEPFFTTKEVGKGTGLGLASVYGIIQEHLGTVQIESTLGIGTAIIIFLPKYHVKE